MSKYIYNVVSKIRVHANFGFIGAKYKYKLLSFFS
jgi:hypothetical protein